MHLPAKVLTPEADFRLSKQQPELRLTGQCSPEPAKPFFDHIMGGDENPRVPGLRKIVESFEGDQLWMVCRLSRINSPSERELKRLCAEFLVGVSPLRIRWIVPEGEINTRRIGRLLHAQYGDRFIVEGDDEQ